MHVLPCGILNHLRDQHEVSLLFYKASYSVFWSLLPEPDALAVIQHT